MAADLPGFLPSLVGVAQRGRSLGIHLVLATQRPAGVVSDEIRANTNLRIALRLQDRADAVDIVGVADPASFPRGVPGRAMLRLGAGETVVFQTAHSSGAHRPPGDGGCASVAPAGPDTATRQRLRAGDRARRADARRSALRRHSATCSRRSVRGSNRSPPCFRSPPRRRRRRPDRRSRRPAPGCPALGAPGRQPRPDRCPRFGHDDGAALAHRRRRTRAALLRRRCPR